MRPSVSYGYISFEKYYDTYALTPAEHSQSNIQDLKTEFSDSSRSNSNTLGFDLSTEILMTETAL
jgi:hypothetical protein